MQTCAGRKHLPNCDVRHLGTSSSQGWATAAARVSLTLWQAGGSSPYKVFQIVVNFVQHTHPSNAVAVIKRLKNLIRIEPRDYMNLTIKKLKVTAGSRPPDRRTIFKDREDEGVWTSNACHEHNFHRRDLKFSDIVPNNITIFKYIFFKSDENLIASGKVALRGPYQCIFYFLLYILCNYA